MMSSMAVPLLVPLSRFDDESHRSTEAAVFNESTNFESHSIRGESKVESNNYTSKMINNYAPIFLTFSMIYRDVFIYQTYTFIIVSCCLSSVFLVRCCLKKSFELNFKRQKGENESKENGFDMSYTKTKWTLSFFPYTGYVSMVIWDVVYLSKEWDDTKKVGMFYTIIIFELAVMIPGAIILTRNYRLNEH